MLSPTVSYLTDIYFEAGITARLGEILAARAIERPLLVTDRGLLALGMPDRLPIEPAATFADVPTNPTEGSVLAGLEVYRGHECDGIVALGGGSPIDCAKAIGLIAAHEPPLEQYALIRGGLERIGPHKPPLVAIPTTAGTGSEVGRGSLITMASGAKLGLISKHLIPTAAVCDPELTLELPARLTAATGMDAVSHCVETFCSPKFNPVAEAIAIDGLGRACRWIRQAVAEGSNLKPRSEMLMAALQGGLTFQKGLGMIHSLSHPLGSLEEKRLHHGTLNAIFLPHVLRFNQNACPEKMERMASVVGAPSASALPDYFAELTANLGLPTRLVELNVQPEEILPLAEAAHQDHCTQTNPRRFTVEDCREMLQAAC